MDRSWRVLSRFGIGWYHDGKIGIPMMDGGESLIRRCEGIKGVDAVRIIVSKLVHDVRVEVRHRNLLFETRFRYP